MLGYVVFMYVPVGVCNRGGGVLCVQAVGRPGRGAQGRHTMGGVPAAVHWVGVLPPRPLWVWCRTNTFWNWSSAL